MKLGANRLEISQIKKGYEQGMSAEEISSILKICVECVASFAPEKKPKKATADKG